jgi:hypothetical protein
MSDIVHELRQGSLNNDDYRWKAADEIERLRAALDTVRASGLLIGSTTIHDMVRAVVHAALAEEKPNE